MLLEVRDLHVSYGDIEAVHGIGFSIDKGELVSIIGTNGAGKTTTLRALMGLQPIKSGSVLFDGTDITSLPAHKRANLGIRMVPERARCFPQLSVYENLLMEFTENPPRSKRNLPTFMSSFPFFVREASSHQHSFGRGTAAAGHCQSFGFSGPRLVFVDEVSMGLMPKLTAQVFEVLRSLNKRKGRRFSLSSRTPLPL